MEYVLRTGGWTGDLLITDWQAMEHQAAGSHVRSFKSQVVANTVSHALMEP